MRPRTGPHWGVPPLFVSDHRPKPGQALQANSGSSGRAQASVRLRQHSIGAAELQPSVSPTERGSSHYCSILKTPSPVFDRYVIPWGYWGRRRPGHGPRGLGKIGRLGTFLQG